MKTTIYATSRYITDAYQFDLIQNDGRRSYIAKPIEFQELTESVHKGSSPAFELRTVECQQLMDELWKVGFRPSEGTGSAGALKQAEDHIASLKRIAFALAEPKWTKN